MEQRTYFGASDVLLAEQEPRRTYLSVTMRMLSTRPNRNGQGVTEAFIDEIIDHPDKYVCTPLYVDEEGLLSKNYGHLGHNYNPQTGEFKTDQIGGFSSFRKVVDEFGVSLYGEARIPKREADICAAICEMYANGMLNFSFEITYVPEGVVMDNGVFLIDAYPGNTLTGMAVVSVPAYPEATALALVAEHKEGQTDLTTGTPVLAEGMSEEANEDEVKTMPKEMENVIAEEVVETEAPATEEVVAEAETENVEEAVVAEETVAEEAVATTSDVVTVDTLGSDVKEHVTETEPAMNADGTGEAQAEIFNVPDPGDSVPADELPEAVELEDGRGTETVEMIEEHHMKIVRRLEMKIAELEEKLSDYEVMKAELDQYKADEKEKERLAKIAKAEAYAKNIGLDVAVAEVRAAVDSMDYEKIADLMMASVEAVDTTESTDTAEKAVICEDMKIETADDNTYGGLIANV